MHGYPRSKKAYSKFANLDIVDTKNLLFLCGSELEGWNPLSE